MSICWKIQLCANGAVQITESPISCFARHKVVHLPILVTIVISPEYCYKLFQMRLCNLNKLHNVTYFYLPQTEIPLKYQTIKYLFRPISNNFDSKVIILRLNSKFALQDLESTCYLHVHHTVHGITP